MVETVGRFVDIKAGLEDQHARQVTVVQIVPLREQEHGERLGPEWHLVGTPTNLVVRGGTRARSALSGAVVASAPGSRHANAFENKERVFEFIKSWLGTSATGRAQATSFMAWT